MHARRYISMILAGILLASVSLLALNLSVDPLDIYRIYKHDGINRIKPKYSSYERIAKPMQIELHQPQWLAFGSSRVLRGIPVSGFDSPVPETKRFNAGLSGANIVIVDELFRHAIAVSGVREVVIGVDFFMFNAYSQQHYPFRLASPGESVFMRWQRHADNLIETLFSPQIASASIYTLRHQQEKYDKYAENGQAINARAIENYLESGYEAPFVRFENDHMQSLWTPCRDNSFRYRNQQFDTLASLHDILVLAAENHIRLRLFIPPTHARLMEALYATGLWDRQQQWKADMLQVVSDVSHQYPASSIELWDFTGYNAYTTEPLPQQKGVAMQWFLESSHFRDTLGARMMQTLETGDTTIYPAVRLVPEMLALHLRQQDTERAKYRQSHHAQYDEIRQRASYWLEQRERHGMDCSFPQE